jgi:hypothetical protein
LCGGRSMGYCAFAPVGLPFWIVAEFDISQIALT